MNDALKNQLQSLDLARIVPLGLAVLGEVIVLLLIRKILRMMMRFGRRRLRCHCQALD